MATTLLHVGKAITPKGEIANAGILLRDGEIEMVGPRSGMELPGEAIEVQSTDSTAIPGFVDVHIHGAGGHDVMEADEAALSTITGKLAAFGTTSLLATTVTASADETCRAVQGISKYITGQYQTNDARAEILGIHFEGPFLSKERRGVHPAEWLQPPSAELLQRFLQAQHPVMRAFLPSRRSYWVRCRASMRRAAWGWWSRSGTPMRRTNRRVPRSRMARITLLMCITPCGRLRTAIPV